MASASFESKFKSSLQAFQQSRSTTTPQHPHPDPSSSSWTSQPQRWIQSFTSTATQQPAPDSDESRGLLSGWTSSNTDSTSRPFEIMCSCCPALSATQRLTVFACFTAGGLFFFFMSFFMLPTIVLAPQKFAFLSCMGSVLLFASLGFLRGWPSHMTAVFSKDRWPFSVGYLLSLVGGIWASVIIHSYLLTLVFIVLHTVALVWYYVSFMPGGISGLRAMTGMMANSGRSFLPV